MSDGLASGAWRAPRALGQGSHAPASTAETSVHSLVAARLGLGSCIGKSAGQTLWEHSSRVAHALSQEDPARLDFPVALLLDPGEDLAAGILGVLRCGGFFLPLDISHPDKQLRDITNRAGVRVIISSESLLPRARTIADGSVAILDTDSLLAGESRIFSDVPTSPGDLACITYTSGSTGAPKGIMHTHRRLIHQSLQHAQSVGMDSGDVCSSIYPPSVFLHVRDLFAAFLTGADLAIYNVREQGWSGMADWLTEEKVTVLGCAATPLRAFLGSLPADRRLLRVRAIDFGGESVFPRDVAALRRHLKPDCEIVHSYGASECGHILRCRLGRMGAFNDEGSPIFDELSADIELDVVDGTGNVVPVGESGVARVTSRYTALGYWQEPELSQQLFLSDPRDPEAITYITGDRLQVLPGEQYVHMGRMDAQLKIHGNRINAGYVEAEIRSCPGVQNAAVVARPDPSGQLALVAYVCLAERRSTGGLAQQMRNRLPPHMVPRLFVSLDELPLNPGGKVDAQRLPEPDWISPVRPLRAVTRYLTPTESMLSALWRDVLPAGAPGIDDGFFELGGDSLLGVSVLVLLERRTGRRLPLSALYEYPTIRLLAGLLDSTVGTIVRKTMIPIRTKGAGGTLFLVNGSADTLVPHLRPEVNLYWLNHLQDRAHAADASVESLARDHLEMIRGVQPTGPYQLAGFSFGGLVAYEMAQQLRACGEEVALLALIDTRPPFRVAPDTPDSAPRHVGWARISRIYRLPVFLRRRLRALTERVIALQTAARYERKGLQMPSRLLKRRNFQLFKDAARRYVCRVYAGPLIYLTTEPRPTSLAQPNRLWASMVSGRLEIRPVPGVKRHLALMREPGVAGLATILNEYVR